MAGFLNDWTQSLRNNIGEGAKNFGYALNYDIEKINGALNGAKSELRQSAKNISGIGSDIREGFRNINKINYSGNDMADLKKLEELQAKELGRVNYAEDPGYVANGISTTGRPHYTNADDFVPGAKTIEEIKNMQMKGTPEWIYDLKNTDLNPNDVMEYINSHPYVAGAAGAAGAAGMYGIGRMLRKNKTTSTGGEEMKEREYARIKQAAAMGNLEAQGIVDEVEGIGITPIVKAAFAGDIASEEFLDNFEAVFGAGSVKQAFLNETLEAGKDAYNYVGNRLNAAGNYIADKYQGAANYIADKYHGAVDFAQHPVANTADAIGDAGRHAVDYMDRGYADFVDDVRDVANGGQNVYLDRAGDGLRHAGNYVNRVYEDTADYIGDAYAANPVGTMALAGAGALGLGAAGYGASRMMRKKTAAQTLDDVMTNQAFANQAAQEEAMRNYWDANIGSGTPAEAYGGGYDPAMFVDRRVIPQGTLTQHLLDAQNMMAQHPYASGAAAAGLGAALGYGAYRALRRRR